MIDKKRRRLLVLFNVPRTSLSAGDWRQYVCHSERLVVGAEPATEFYLLSQANSVVVFLEQ